ncbi:dethiobiotin synthase [Corynebacterium mayonis]|uniref:dethiobiotin synthase n=1 Tax=Corynebacterium mayonis TaxID=3062461 RepID=UPI003140B26F
MIVAVTGTGTDVGKTIATAAVASRLARTGRDVVLLKPVQTGAAQGGGDAETVHRLTGVEAVTGWSYPEPLAPNLAARRAGQPTPCLAQLRDWIQGYERPDRVVLVEGAGGLAVRIGDDYTFAEVAHFLGAPALVVTSLGLGSLNLATLTVEAARRSGVVVAGLIGGALEAESDLATTLNLEELPVVTGVPLIGVLPAGAGVLDPEDFAVVAQKAVPELPF